MPALGLGVSIPKILVLGERKADTEFITFTVPQSNYVYFGKCISGHIGVDYEIDLTTSHNKVFFGKCISGTREVTDAIYGS